MDVQFGAEAPYLVDFYHRCDCLAAAGEVIAGNDKPQWIAEKKNWLKDNRWQEVLEALRPFLEAAHLPDAEAPVRACFRYISNHSKFLDYKGALAAGLPIGSGEMESAHFSGSAQGPRWLVEGGKPKKDDCAACTASAPRFRKITGPTAHRTLHN